LGRVSPKSGRWTGLSDRGYGKICFVTSTCWRLRCNQAGRKLRPRCCLTRRRSRRCHHRPRQGKPFKKAVSCLFFNCELCRCLSTVLLQLHLLSQKWLLIQYWLYRVIPMVCLAAAEKLKTHCNGNCARVAGKFLPQRMFKRGTIASVSGDSLFFSDPPMLNSL
jgi:hypothetical protein